MSNPLEKLAEKWADKVADVIALEGARTRAVLEAGLTETRNANRVFGARPEPLTPNARNATGRGRLLGWSLRETAGAAAVVTVYAAADNSDPSTIVATVPLAAAAGATIPPGAPGIGYAEGLYVAVTGAVTGALYFG